MFSYYKDKKIMNDRQGNSVFINGFVQYFTKSIIIEQNR